MSENNTELKPFDKIIGRKNHLAWHIGFFSNYASVYDNNAGENKFVTVEGHKYAECIKYEDWMSKYIGTVTPYNEWKKD